MGETSKMNEVIPAQAVEAAAYALYLDANPDTETQWFDITFHEQDELMRTATKALEAAAPHMLAEAWEQGYMCSYDQERGGRGVGTIPVPEYLADDLKQWNPHRKEAK